MRLSPPDPGTPRRLHIGLFTDTFLPDQNGIVTSVGLLSDELRRLGHRVEVVAPHFPEQRDEHVGPDGGVRRVASVRYPLLPTYRLAWPTQRLFSERYDVIHTHTPLTLGLAGARLARRWGVPHVATYHTHLEAYTHYVPGLTSLNRVTGLVPKVSGQLYARAQAVIAPTAEMLSVLERAGVRGATVIPTSVDPAVLEGAPPVQSPWPPGKRRLLTGGRLAREKRFELVLDALAALPDAHLVLFGEGPEREALSAHAERLGVSERVTFLGVIPWREIGAYYRLAELFMFASDTETQGLVLQEAQLMGVPVVTVGARGTLSSVQSGYSGFLVPPGDVPGLVAAARDLLDDPQRWGQFSRQAREFSARVTPAGVAAQVAGVYGRVLGLSPVSAPAPGGTTTPGVNLPAVAGHLQSSPAYDQ